MASGLLSGLLWGAGISLTAAVALSTLVPLPSPPQVRQTDLQATLQPAPENDRPNLPDTTADAVRDPAVVPVLPTPDAVQAPQVETTQTAAQPETGNADALASPDDVADDGRVAVAEDSAVLPSPQALAPMAPPQTDDVELNTAPAPLPVPPTVAVQAPVVDDDAPQIADVPAAADDPALADNAASPEADAPATPDASQVAEQPQAPEAPVVDESVAEAPKPLPTAPATPDAVAEEETAEETAEDDTAETETAALAPQDPLRPRIGKPATTLTNRSTGVRVNRSVGATDATAPAAETAGEEAPDADGLPPLKRYARDFENTAEKPLMAIVLIDDGADLKAPDRGLAALRKFPYPVSIAINATLPDANARMDAYRAEGFEVLAMVDLPAGALPADAEVNLSVALEKLPETVAVLDGLNGGLQPSRETADQVTSILGQSGHGLVAQAQGLNTMPKLANKAGVAAAPVFRDFDGKDQSAQVIRRFLDQAAFKAGQEGAVIMQGRIRPETIEALLVWGLADRAGKVALAPISAVLQGGS